MMTGSVVTMTVRVGMAINVATISMVWVAHGTLRLSRTSTVTSSSSDMWIGRLGPLMNVFNVVKNGLCNRGRLRRPLLKQQSIVTRICILLFRKDRVQIHHRIRIPVGHGRCDRRDLWRNVAALGQTVQLQLGVLQNVIMQSKKQIIHDRVLLSAA